MKLFGWALILAGGGLVVYGVRRLSKPSDEPGDPDYDPQGESGPDEWEQHLLDVEQQERNAHTHVCDTECGS